MKIKKKLARLTALSLCALVAMPAFAADAGTLMDLLEKNDAAKAYELGSASIVQQAGEPTFDLYYGIAALQSGHYREATYILERVLIANPKNLRARLELAMAFYAVGNYDASKANFDYVLNANPPKIVREKIVYMLDRIAQHQAGLGDPSKFVIIGLKTGYDTNVNSATRLTAINIPTLGNIILNNGSRAGRSPYVDLDLSTGFITPINQVTMLFGKFGLAGHRNTNDITSSFDTDSINGIAGVIYSINDRMKVTVPVSFQSINLNGVAFKHVLIYGGEFSHQWNTLNKYTIFGDITNDVNPMNVPQDGMIYTGGLSWQHKFSAQKVNAVGKVFRSRRVIKQVAFNFNSAKDYGLSGDLEFRTDEKYKPYLGLVLDKTFYDSRHSLFALIRRDSIVDFSAGIRWDYNPRISCDTKYRYLRINSNIPVFAINRHVVEFGLKYRIA